MVEEDSMILSKVSYFTCSIDGRAEVKQEEPEQVIDGVCGAEREPRSCNLQRLVYYATRQLQVAAQSLISIAEF